MKKLVEKNRQLQLKSSINSLKINAKHVIIKVSKQKKYTFDNVYFLVTIPLYGTVSHPPCPSYPDKGDGSFVQKNRQPVKTARKREYRKHMNELTVTVCSIPEESREKCRKTSNKKILLGSPCRMALVVAARATTQDWEGFSLRSVCTATTLSASVSHPFNLARSERRDKERKRKDYP